MARIVFYANDNRENIEAFEYYKQDIEALQALGHDVVVCNSYREIPRQFDAMFVWWWTYALWPVLLCRLKGKPCLVTGVFNLRFPPEFVGIDYFHRPAHQRALIRAATELATLNLFIDETETTECAKYFGLDNARYYPCIIHDDYLKGPGPQRELAIFNLAWSGKGNLIRKGIPELLRAMRLLKDRGVAAHLYQAGHQGDGVDFLTGMIAELGIEDRVTYLGPLERGKKIELLRTYEVYAQPSHYEGFGLATLEAMGAGACVIVCNVGAVPSVVGDAGIYVKPGSPEDLADGITRAMTDEPLRRRMQQDAEKRAKSIFTSASKRQRLRQYLAEVGIS